jgi:hypothetical protein
MEHYFSQYLKHAPPSKLQRRKQSVAQLQQLFSSLYSQYLIDWRLKMVREEVIFVNICLHLPGELKEVSKVAEVTVDDERISISAVAYDNYRVRKTTSACVRSDHPNRSFTTFAS